MSGKEFEFYRWMETFTLSHTAGADDPHLAFALARGYVERVKTDTGFAVTRAGWEWFAVRSAVIVTRCNAGFHEYAPKTPFCSAVHCRWCGHCEEWPCPECERFSLTGTIEGGWVEPLTATFDINPRSTISHGQEHS